MRTFSLPIFVAFAACGSGNELGRGAQTSLTSGEAHPSKPPESHTVDDTGFVDNGGRASDEASARPETSGARTTETGGDRPTGTTTGAPNGARTSPDREREPALVPRSAELQPRGGVSPIAGYDDAPGKMGRAICDHEAACGRVREGATWASDAECLATTRAREMSDLDAMRCRLDGSAVATCLAELRRAPCERVIDRAASIGACAEHSICAR